MSSPAYDLDYLFERAFENRDRIIEGDLKSLDWLNTHLSEKKLGGRLVVLTQAEEDLHPASIGASHSHLYPSGRLGDFAVKYYEDGYGPELVVAVNDVRDSQGNTHLAPLTGKEVPFDVVTEQKDSKLLAEIKALITGTDFSFSRLASLCAEIGVGNLNLALFAASLNDYRLPHQLAKAVYTQPRNVFYWHNAKDVAPYMYGNVRYGIGREDMFSFRVPKNSGLFFTSISTMVPFQPTRDFRDIVINGSTSGYDLA